jgi:hypothetical protein
MLRYRFGKVIRKTRVKSSESFKSNDLRQASTVIEVNVQDFSRFWQFLAVFDLFLCLMFLSINYYKKVGEITLLTSYQKSLVKLVDCFKSYEL